MSQRSSKNKLVVLTNQEKKKGSTEVCSDVITKLIQKCNYAPKGLKCITIQDYLDYPDDYTTNSWSAILMTYKLVSKVGKNNKKYVLEVRERCKTVKLPGPILRK